MVFEVVSSFGSKRMHFIRFRVKERGSSWHVTVCHGEFPRVGIPCEVVDWSFLFEHDLAFVLTVEVDEVKVGFTIV